MEVTSTEAQNNFGQYLKFTQFEDIIVTKNGRRIAVISAYREKKDDIYQVPETADEFVAARHKYTFEEFLKLSEGSDKRYEYIDGEVYLLSSPNYSHQSIIIGLIDIMLQWFRGKKCKVLTSPFDVTLLRGEDKNVVQPDIIVICDKDKVNEKGRYMGTPTLVIEVLSESTRRMDMLKKLDLYTQSGIHEYWVVNPFNREIYIYSYIKGDIADYKVYKAGETARSIYFEGLEISLEHVFENL